MNLAIIGYGKMGRLIDQLAPEYGFDVLAKLEGSNNGGKLSRGGRRGGLFGCVCLAEHRAAWRAWRQRGDRHNGLDATTRASPKLSSKNRN